jgi:hypothetical protein
MDHHKLTPEEQREADLYADVFNPHESDLEYFQRRRRELSAPKPANVEAPGIGKVPVRN